MRKPNYNHERMERERAKEAKAREKLLKRQGAREPRPGESETDATDVTDASPTPPKADDPA